MDFLFFLLLLEIIGPWFSSRPFECPVFLFPVLVHAFFLYFVFSLPPGFEFFEASAKDNINVKQTFERLVDIICEKMSESLDAADPAVTGAKQGPQLTDQQAPPHQDCAC